MNALFLPALFLAAIGSGVMGGFFFAFSNLVMASLGRVPPGEGILVMQTINIVVQNPVFFLFFFGTPIACAIVGLLTLFNISSPAMLIALLGAIIYIAGIFVVTVAFNVPMNEALAAVDPSSTAGQSLWADYLVRWTNWNHVRTVAGIVAMAAFLLAFWQRSGAQA